MTSEQNVDTEDNEIVKELADNFKKVIFADDFNSDKAVIEEMIKRHLDKKYSTKILNVPLIDQITKDINEALANIRIADSLKSKIIKNARDSLFDAHLKIKRQVQEKLKELKEKQEKSK